MRFAFLVISICCFIGCSQSKIKVVAESYENENPKIIRYFSSKKDSKEVFSIIHSNGAGTATKPLSFLQEGYYENGNLQFRGHFIKGETSGLWEYFYETGIPEARCYYRNSRTTDSVFCWVPSGKLMRRAFEIDTVNNYWRAIDYFENGKINIEGYFIRDSRDSAILNGSFREWYDNGNLKITAIFKNGSTVGKWKEYDRDGKLKKESDEPFSITFE